MAASLRSDGWYIDEDAYHRLLDSAKTQAGVVNSLLNTDLKEVAVAALPVDFAKTKPSKLTGPLVLQIQKLRNVSAPTTRQESATAPRMFRFSLSDGFQNIPAIELEALHNVGFRTAPGCKLLVKGNAQMNQGIVLLTNGNCKMLGGKVDTMYERWQLNKDLLKISRNTNRADGPPPFVPFGQKVKKEQVQQQLTGKFNSLEMASAMPATERDNTEFDAQRKAVIDEALQQSATKKNYGGIKQVNAGIPLEKAEFKRPERKAKKPTVDDKDPNVSDDEDQGRGRGRRGRRGRYAEEEGEHLAPGRPSAANTLFDFLGGRLASDDSTNKAGAKANEYQSHPSQQDSRGKGYDDYSSVKQGYNQRHTRGGRSDEGHTSARGDTRRPHATSQSSGQYRQGSQSAGGNHRQHDNNRYSNQSAGGNPRQQDNNRYSNQSTGGNPRQQDNNRYSNQSASGNPRQQDNNRYSNQSTGGNPRQQANNRYNNQSAGGNPRQQDNKQSKGSERSYGNTSSRQQGNMATSKAGCTQHDEREDNSHRESRKSSSRNDNSHSVANSKNSTGGKSSAQAEKRADNSSKSSQSVETARSDQPQKDDGPYAGRMYSDDMQESRPPPSQCSVKEKSTTGSAVACNPGNIVMAKYWEDGQFYRYRVTSNVSPKVVRGVFLDYGNTEDVQLRDIKPIPNRQDRGAQAKQSQQATGPLRHGEYDGDYSHGLTFGRSRSGR